MTAQPAADHPGRSSSIYALSDLVLIGLGLRLLAFVMFPHPGYPDASYYAATAREMAAGHGVIAPYIWSFLDVGSVLPAQPQLPIPAFGHWLPLAAFVQIPFIYLLGPSDLASALPFILAGALLGPMTYLLARDLAPRAPAFLAGTLASGGGVIAGYLAQPDNFALFALFATGALWAGGRIARDGRHVLRVSAVAGGCVALASLSRADGLLLLPAILMAPVVLHLPSLRRGLVLRAWLTAGIVFLGILSPWWLYQIGVFGAAYPSALTGRVLWIRDSLEMFSIDGTLGADHLLDWGIGPLLDSRLAALGNVIRILVAGALSVILVPLSIVGAPNARSAGVGRAWVPWGIWLTTWLAFEVVLAAPHLESGHLLHSALAVTPWVAISAGVGVVALARILGPRPRLGSAVGGAAVALTLFLALNSITSATTAFRALRVVETPAAAYLTTNAPGELVMSPDPGGLWTIAQIPGVGTPTSSLAHTESAVRAYGVRWLFLIRGQTTSALLPILDGQRVAWLSPAVLYDAQPDDPDLAWGLYRVLASESSMLP